MSTVMRIVTGRRHRLISQANDQHSVCEAGVRPGHPEYRPRQQTD